MSASQWQCSRWRLLILVKTLVHTRAHRLVLLPMPPMAPQRSSMSPQAAFRKPSLPVRFLSLLVSKVLLKTPKTSPPLVAVDQTPLQSHSLLHSKPLYAKSSRTLMEFSALTHVLCLRRARFLSSHMKKCWSSPLLAQRCCTFVVLNMHAVLIYPSTFVRRSLNLMAHSCCHLKPLLPLSQKEKPWNNRSFPVSLQT